MPFTNLEEPESDSAVILDALKNMFVVKEIRIDVEEFAQFCNDLNYPSEYSDTFWGLS